MPCRPDPMASASSFVDCVPTIEAMIGRYKQVIGGGPRSRTDRRRATAVEVAVRALNRMLEFGRPSSIRIA